MQTELTNELITLQSRIKEGDIEAFELFFRRYYPRLKLFATRLVGDENCAEDFTQDTFFLLWENRETIKENGNLKSWIFLSLRNHCLNYLKKQKIQQRYVEYASYENSSQELFLTNFLEEDEIIKLKSAMLQEVHQIIETLPPQCKKVFELSRFQKLKNKEISEQLNISIKTVEKHISHAMKILRKEMHTRSFIFLLLFRIFFNS